MRRPLSNGAFFTIGTISTMVFLILVVWLGGGLCTEATC